MIFVSVMRCMICCLGSGSYSRMMQLLQLCSALDGGLSVVVNEAARGAQGAAAGTQERHCGCVRLGWCVWCVMGLKVERYWIGLVR